MIRDTDEKQEVTRDTAMTLATLRVHQLAGQLGLARHEDVVLIYVGPPGAAGERVCTLASTIESSEELRQTLVRVAERGLALNNDAEVTS